jgi:2-polyprenyl-3-methyl-5-hydroxy-6-metoxy-1,4-benzoquinol methylase
VKSDGGRKTSRGFWEQSHGGKIRLRLPSLLNVGTRDILRLLSRRIRPGMSVLEIGFAPGKHLAYVAKNLGGCVHGVDYSEPGVVIAAQLFAALEISGELRCEDVFSVSFPQGSFDFVYSIGFVEHFEDARPIVRLHLEMVKPGGKVMIAVPNYGGIYGHLQRWLDPDNLAIHNLGIMSIAGLQATLPEDLSVAAKASPAGCLSPWILSLDRWLPYAPAHLLSLGLNVAGLMQPFEIGFASPLLVLDVTRVPSS